MKYDPVTNKRELKIDWYNLSGYSSSDLLTLSEFIEIELDKRHKKSIR
tara:strand:- start:179 stop:322 length:144 start_codon:yes stop_codon:yes gene_type:complete